MIFLSCLLTVVLEGAFLAAVGYRDRFSLTVIVCANVVTNLLLNLLLWLVPALRPLRCVLALEACVVAAEYAIYATAFGRSAKLFFLTLAANCVSYGLGLLIFRSM